jgi:hypothetical protein
VDVADGETGTDNTIRIRGNSFVGSNDIMTVVDGLVTSVSPLPDPEAETGDNFDINFHQYSIGAVEEIEGEPDVIIADLSSSSNPSISVRNGKVYLGVDWGGAGPPSGSPTPTGTFHIFAFPVSVDGSYTGPEALWEPATPP